MRFTARVERRDARGRGQTARRLDVQRVEKWHVRLATAAADGNADVRLWAAVLIDAMAALRGRHPNAYDSAPKAARLWREAVAWVLERDLEPLGTFESVCGVLGLPVAEVRRDLCGLAVQHAPACAPTTAKNDAEVAA